MNPSQYAHHYTGAWRVPAPAFAYPREPMRTGYCHHCGQPSAQCQCGCRQCRSEPRELVAESKATGDTTRTGLAALLGTSAAAAQGNAADNSNTAFIGGGCCVHLSVEYAPVTPTATSAVAVLVRDSEGTVLGWERQEQTGAHYQVKENIITTKPGATVTVMVSNMVARVRWCEVFSC